MTAKPIALAKARAMRDAIKARNEYLEAQLRCMQQLLGCTLELGAGASGSTTLYFSDDDLECFDPGRIVIIQMEKHNQWIVGLKETSEQPLELDHLTKAALHAVSEPVAQLAEQEPLTLKVGGSNPSGLAKETPCSDETS